MALTEHYVTDSGTDTWANSTNSATPCSLATALANAAAGDRVNIKAGSYSQGVVTVPTGTASDPLVFRGYNSTIGDLDDQGRNSDGSLNTTNMPDITVTGIWAIQPNTVLQNLDFTGAISSTLLGNTSYDYWTLINCRVVNTQNNASARCIQGDNFFVAIGCDFSCTGAAHATVVDMDLGGVIYMCRFEGTSSSALLSCEHTTIQGSTFIGNSTNKGISFVGTWTGAYPAPVTGNTFYNLATAIETTVTSASSCGYIIGDNHVTDCAKYIDNLYSATADIWTIEFCNRTRDNTTPRTGVEEGARFGEVTTDTGGASTDYEDAANDNFFLISGAPGVGQALGQNQDCGAYQRAPGSGSGTTNYYGPSRSRVSNGA